MQISRSQNVTAVNEKKITDTKDERFRRMREYLVRVNLRLRKLCGSKAEEELKQCKF